jgi:uncharacterized protein YjbI with pentapeptide repeats
MYKMTWETIKGEKMTKRELTSILKKHQKWLDNEKGGERADLSSADLRYANLRYADFRSADFRSADLSSADLRYANLSSANLSSADLRYANLRYADLRYANLSSADLRYANLRSAELDNNTIKEINRIRPFQICPQEGEFIAWKKGRGGEIIKLLIPADAKRTSSLAGRKCRCSKAKVLEIVDKDGNQIQECKNWNASYDFTYKVGETAEPDSYNDDIREECTNGIHFFITREEAEMWQ